MSDPREYRSVPCPLCGDTIDPEHRGTAVMINVWLPRFRRYVAEGPFHGECGAQRARHVNDAGHRGCAPDPLPLY